MHLCRIVSNFHFSLLFPLPLPLTPTSPLFFFILQQSELRFHKPELMNNKLEGGRNWVVLGVDCLRRTTLGREGGRGERKERERRGKEGGYYGSVLRGMLIACRGLGGDGGGDGDRNSFTILSPPFLSPFTPPSPSSHHFSPSMIPPLLSNLSLAPPPHPSSPFLLPPLPF